jgi:hypothetical protein
VARSILRFLSSRYGVALVLLLFVVGVVSVARAISGPSETGTVGPPPPPLPSVSAIPSDLGDDGVTSPESVGPSGEPQDPPPSLAPGAKAPEVVALDFAQAWVRGRGASSAQWLKSMEPSATPDLLGRLKETDPSVVPADSVRGPVQIRRRGSHETDVTVPVSPGLLHLRLVPSTGRWLVDRVDWERP